MGADLLPLIATAWASVAQGQIPPMEVIKGLISKALGYGVIAGSCMVKVPQIQVILKGRSAEGLAFLSFELEALVLLIHTSYGYLTRMPFSAYGEVFALEIQTLILLALVYSYGKASTLRVALVFGGLMALAGVVLSGQLSESQVQAAFSANTLLFMAARVPQIWTNLRSHSTGQLSIVTCAINVLGNLARVFTTMQEGGGVAMLRLYLLALALNVTLVAQILLYRPKAAAGRPKAAAGRPKAKGQAKADGEAKKER